MDQPAANQITTETSKVLDYNGSADPDSVTSEGPDYGALKILCEQEAARQFPARSLVIRPGYIAGPAETHAPLPYWVLRMQRGGEVLAVGDPTTPVQIIDVRDMAEWIVRMIEKRAIGTYNAVGPVPPLDLAHLVSVARATVPKSPKVTWITSAWLAKQKDRELFDGLLFWEEQKGYLTGISNERALSEGLTTRSIEVTLADELRWLKDQPPQTDIVTGYRRKADGSGFERVVLPWPVYLEHERTLLASWHAQERKPA
jgi:2'-hydroxyisoflavone reductase